MSVLRTVGGHIGKLSWTHRRALLAVGVVVPVTVAFVAVLSVGDVADAHGSLESPSSRIYYCRFGENPENPTSAACRAAIAVSGTQAVYDWNEVNQPNAGGNHRAVIPDGQLCSAGRDKYRGFDLPRADWPATSMTSGAPYHFRMLGTAAHVGTVELYVTRNGYDPTQALRWSDLEPTPFLTITRTQYPADYSASAQLPAGKSGRHAIYMIWQRSDSPEAFYACSDVDFGGGGAVPMPPVIDDATAPAVTDHATAPEPADAHVSHVPTSEAGPDYGSDYSDHADHADHAHTDHGQVPLGGASSTDPHAGAQWSAGTAYQVGALVRFGGRTYRCLQAHTAQLGWEPSTTPALWVRVTETSADGTISWQPNTSYAIGQVVGYNGRFYRCRQGHVSLTGWEPTNTPALWELVS